MHGAGPTERQTTRRSVDDHQGAIDDECDGKTASGEGQMRATIKDISGEAADGEFENEKRPLAMLEQLRHECVAFGGDVQAHPKQRELGIEPVESKQEQAFRKCTHGSFVPTLFKPLLITPEPPSLSLGVLDVTGGTRLVLMLY